MADPDGDRNNPYSRITMSTQEEVEKFTRAIHKVFIQTVHPFESGLVDALFNMEIINDTLKESIKGDNLRTRQHQARRLFLVLASLPVHVFVSKVIPELYSRFPYVIPEEFKDIGGGLHSALKADDEENIDIPCVRCAIQRKVPPSIIADFLFEAGNIHLEPYKEIILDIDKDSVDKAWMSIFKSFGQVPHDIKLIDEIKWLLKARNINVPHNLNEIMMHGFPCTCSKQTSLMFLNDTRGEFPEKVESWLQDQTKHSLTVPDLEPNVSSDLTGVTFFLSSDDPIMSPETYKTDLATNVQEICSGVERKSLESSGSTADSIDMLPDVIQNCIYVSNRSESTRGYESMNSCSLSDVEADLEYTSSSLVDKVLSQSSFQEQESLITRGNVSRATQTDTDCHPFAPPPIFAKEWKMSTCVSSAGGVVEIPNSDVTLHVPRDAVDRTDYVDVLASVSVDLDLARYLLKLNDEERIVSPVAEYQAGDGFCFRKGLSIELPHVLPINPDTKLIRVYRVRRNVHGGLTVTRIPLLHSDKHNEHTTLQNRCKESYDRKSDSHETGNNEEPFTEATNEEHTLNDGTTVQWDEDTFFLLSSDSRLRITTTCFSAYVCTYCGHRQGPPTLYVIASGSNVRLKDRQIARVSVHVWDEKLRIKDFQQACGITVKTLEKTNVRCASATVGSKLHMRLRIIGTEGNTWKHSTDSGGQVGCNVEKSFLLESLVSCDGCDTSRNHTRPPIRADWVLDGRVQPDQDSMLICVVDIVNVNGNEDPQWGDGSTTQMTVMIETPMTESECQKDTVMSHLLKLELRHLEIVASRIGVSTEDVQQLKQRLSSVNDVKMTLVKQCLDKAPITTLIDAMLFVHESTSSSKRTNVQVRVRKMSDDSEVFEEMPFGLNTPGDPSSRAHTDNHLSVFDDGDGQLSSSSTSGETDVKGLYCPVVKADELYKDPPPPYAEKAN